MPNTNTKDTRLSRDEAFELLRYFIGNPPYIQDRRYRELADTFAQTDNRAVNPDGDARTPESQFIDRELAESDTDALTGATPDTTDTDDRNTAAEIAGKGDSKK